jgi:hypothetical protein
MRHHYTDPDTGRKVYAPGPEDEQVPWCPYCGNVRVEADDETCPACLDLQREKAADQAPALDLVDFTRSFFGIPKETK